MRVGVQVDTAVQSSKNPSASTKVESIKVESTSNESIENAVKAQSQAVKVQNSTEEKKDIITKEKLTEAIESINEFLNIQHKASKFVFHEGLDKYYVQLVDTDTEEVIKEIPPERLLNSFYEMKKLAGIIVDERI